MYYTSPLLERLFEKYDILNLPFGVVGDKLGDLFEEYIILCLESSDNLYNYTSSVDENSSKFFSLDYNIFSDIINKSYIDKLEINKITATSDVELRTTGGLPKTDIIADLYLNSNEKTSIPISCKQTTAQKVSFAEFDVDTIVNEIGITDSRLIYLLTKHQEDASAKNFTVEEKLELNELLKPIARNFVRWVVTGSPKATNDLKIPKIIVKFQLEKETYKIIDYYTYTVEEYIDHLMLKPNGNIKPGGFGTGLGWTYATGSKGSKIQFKG